MSTVAVVGGGIAGLAAAWRLRRAAERGGASLRVRLIEAEGRLGGRIGVERRDGFLIDIGPDSFLQRKPAAVELARELGLGDRLIGTREAARRVWILRRGRLVELPPDMGPAPCRLAPVFASELLSWRGKLRLAADLVLPRRRRGSHDPADESLGAFLRRRFGREAVEAFAGPLLAGIYSADPESLSLRATFPQFAEIERRHGSLIRGLRNAERAGRGGAGRRPEPVTTRVSLAGGVGELVAALERALTAPGADVELLLGRRVVGMAPRGCGEPEPTPDATRQPVTDPEAEPDDHQLVSRSGPSTGAATLRDAISAPPGWHLALSDGSSLDADAVILAAPAHAAAPLAASAGPETAALAAGLSRIRFVSTAVVTLAYREADLPRPLDGYGFVVPAGERRRITACTWTSAKLAGRTPPGGALLRVFVGGPSGEHHLEVDDEALVALAREELAELMELAATPLFATVHRHPLGTPRYDVGHTDRVAALQAALPLRLHLAGSSYHGLGLPDCITSGQQAAEAALAELYDPLRHLLDTAPLDDEELTEDDLAAIRTGHEEQARGETVSHLEVKRLSRELE